MYVCITCEGTGLIFGIVCKESEKAIIVLKFDSSPGNPPCSEMVYNSYRSP